MFVPPYQVLLNALHAAPSGADAVSVPRPLLELMLRLLVAGMPFDRDTYLRRNPDIAEALAEGKIDDPHRHFITRGYFEGRIGGAPPVDEAWYERHNPDVAREIAAGRIASAAGHYERSGAAEWRSPSAEQQVLVAEWHEAASPGGRAPAIPPTPLPRAYLDAMRRR